MVKWPHGHPFMVRFSYTYITNYNHTVCTYIHNTDTYTYNIKYFNHALPLHYINNKRNIHTVAIINYLNKLEEIDYTTYNGKVFIVATLATLKILYKSYKK